MWVEEAAPPSLPWGRRPMSPTAYTPPDPLGLSTEGDESKFPEEELNELFPDGYVMFCINLEYLCFTSCLLHLFISADGHPLRDQDLLQ